MSRFSVSVKRISAISAHPKSEILEVAYVGGYPSVVKKGTFNDGDLVAYIPESSIVPDEVLKFLGLWDEKTGKGRCAGPEGRRVKAVFLRDQLSQGLLYPVSHLDVTEGDDLKERLGIVKWQPEVPSSFEGLTMGIGNEHIADFDIDDIKMHPGILVEGEEVVMTEKVHGVYLGLVKLPKRVEIEGLGRYLVFSKGMGQSGVVFLLTPDNADNLYVAAVNRLGLLQHVDRLADYLGEPDVPVFIMGEIFGPDVQDLPYGTETQFRAFASGSGGRADAVYLDYDRHIEAMTAVGVQAVPFLYRGPLTAEALTAATNGKETVSGVARHIREGAIVIPVVERRHRDIGRVVLKSVSPAYIKRGGKATEYS